MSPKNSGSQQLRMGRVILSSLKDGKKTVSIEDIIRKAEISAPGDFKILLYRHYNGILKNNGDSVELESDITIIDLEDSIRILEPPTKRGERKK